MKNFGRNISDMLLALLVITLVACGGNAEQETSSQEMEPVETIKTDTTQANTSAVTKLNMNTASEEEFRTIPNVGDRMVHEFEEYRPYVSIQQFRKEIGKYVNEDQVAAYEEYIFVPIHRNDSDSETLMQIPGLDASEVQELVGARPFETDQAFFDALTSYISEDELATAKTYMKTE